MRLKEAKREEVKQYCHLCSNGEVISGLNRINRELEEAHKHCISNQNEYGIKAIQLQQELVNAKERANLMEKENLNLSGRINGLEKQNQILVEQLKQT